MIITIEDNNGNEIGAVRITENNLLGETEIKETKGDISIADIELDYIFNTNENLIRLQLTK